MRKAEWLRVIALSRLRRPAYRDPFIFEFHDVARTDSAQVVDEFCERMTEWMLKRSRSEW